MEISETTFKLGSIVFSFSVALIAIISMQQNKLSMNYGRLIVEQTKIIKAIKKKKLNDILLFDWSGELSIHYKPPEDSPDDSIELTIPFVFPPSIHYSTGISYGKKKGCIKAFIYNHFTRNFKIIFAKTSILGDIESRKKFSAWKNLIKKNMPEYVGPEEMGIWMRVGGLFSLLEKYQTYNILFKIIIFFMFLSGTIQMYSLFL